jgi:hypothetical protein
MRDATFTFHTRLEELKRYKSIHGNISVKLADNRPLAKWLSDHQRKKALLKILLGYQYGQDSIRGK